jgi:hypothetical protein
MQKTDAPAPVGATATEALREELCSMECVFHVIVTGDFTKA